MITHHYSLQFRFNLVSIDLILIICPVTSERLDSFFFGRKNVQIHVVVSCSTLQIPSTRKEEDWGIWLLIVKAKANHSTTCREGTQRDELIFILFKRNEKYQSLLPLASNNLNETGLSLSPFSATVAPTQPFRDVINDCNA